MTWQSDVLQNTQDGMMRPPPLPVNFLKILDKAEKKKKNHALINPVYLKCSVFEEAGSRYKVHTAKSLLDLGA